MRPPIHQLEYFVAVAEEGQFTRAAARLHVAQPSVSAQIRQLELTLGASLFHRGSGPVTLTDAGEALLPIARRVLTDVTELSNELAEVEGLRRGHVGIGATPSLSATLLPAVLGRFHNAHPSISLTVSEQGSTHLLQGLASGELDLALAVLPVHHPDIDRTVLAIEELVVVIRDDYPLASRRRIGISDLADIPIVMFREGYDLRVRPCWPHSPMQDKRLGCPSKEERWGASSLSSARASAQQSSRASWRSPTRACTCSVSRNRP